MGTSTPMAFLLLVLTVSFLQLTRAAPQTTKLQREPLLAVRETFPTYQVNPSTILWSPSCASADPDTCLGTNAIKSCTIKYCSKKVAFTCWHHAYLIDLECLCTSMSNTTCTSCSSGINNELYLAWLASSCSISPDWDGLNTGWNNSLPGWDLIEIGSSSSKSSGRTYEDDDPFTSQWVKDNHNYPLTIYPPTCSENCTWLNSRWNASIVDGSVADALTRANLLPLNYTNGEAPQNKTFYLDRTLFCTGWLWDDFQSNCTQMCDTGLNNTGLLTWLNSTCGNVTEFTGLPSDWSDSLVVLNSTYPAQNNFTWPSCLKTGDYSDCQLNTTESQCTSSRCVPDEHGDCTSTLAVSLECFCSKIQYGTNCTRNCGLSWERKEYLTWLNDTCFPIGPGTGLPANWTDLLSVQRSEMLPWSWQLSSEIQTSPGGSAQPHCPSASSKLWAFAAVNLALALMIPVIGRRTVVKKLSFGYMGRQESQRWYFTGPFAVGLHLASNAVNAVIIKNTIGFENISIKDLTFLWCTRPRIAWLVVALLPWQAKKAMYFSAAASTLFAEVVLQLFGSYYMGMGANYARKQKFFIKDHLVGTWYGSQAMIMYAGSLLWLTAVAFAIIACVWTVLGVSGRITSLGAYWIETRMTVKTNCDFISTQLGLLNAARSKLTRPGDIPWRRTIEGFQQEVTRSIETLVEEWNQSTITWRSLPDELRQEFKDRKARKDAEKKAQRLKDHTREGSKHWDERYTAANKAGQAVIDFDTTWFTTTPQTKQNEARVQQGRMVVQINTDKRNKDIVDYEISECEDRILPLQNAIEEAQGRLKEDDDEIATIQEAQQEKVSKSSRAGNLEQLRILRSRREAMVEQRLAHDKQLTAAKNNPRLIQENSLLKDLQAVANLWTEVIKSRENLQKNWEENEKEWGIVAEKRKTDSEKKPRVGRFPIVVVAGMLLCWIAQWLWWAGYIGVAGDGYCPPKLPLIASIWTIFSTTGMLFGTSF